MGNEIITFKFFHLSAKGASSLKPSVLGPGFTAPPGGEAYLNRLTWHGGHNRGCLIQTIQNCDELALLLLGSGLRPRRGV